MIRSKMYLNQIRGRCVTITILPSTGRSSKPPTALLGMVQPAVPLPDSSSNLHQEQLRAYPIFVSSTPRATTREIPSLVVCRELKFRSCILLGCRCNSQLCSSRRPGRPKSKAFATRDQLWWTACSGDRLSPYAGFHPDWRRNRPGLRIRLPQSWACSRLQAWFAEGMIHDFYHVRGKLQFCHKESARSGSTTLNSGYSRNDERDFVVREVIP